MDMAHVECEGGLSDKAFRGGLLTLNSTIVGLSANGNHSLPVRLLHSVRTHTQLTFIFLRSFLCRLRFIGLDGPEAR